MDFVPYVLLASLVLGLNIIPAFMPPTWIVLAFFVIKYQSAVLPVVLIGAMFATLGRVILAKLSRKYFRRFLPNDSKDNYESMGKYLDSHGQITVPLVLLYSFSPISSNYIFIAAGLAKMRLELLAGSFFVGRLISYTFWVYTTHKLSDNFVDLFGLRFAKAGSIIVEILGLIVIYLLGKIAWKKILKQVDKK